MEFRNGPAIRSLEHLIKSDLPTIRIGLNAAFKPRFNTLIEQEADTILLTITTTLSHLCQLAPEDFDEFLIQHGDTLKHGIYQAKNALAQCTIDTSSWNREPFYMTAQAIMIQAIMKVLKTIISENENLPPNPPPPPPPPTAPAAALPRMRIPVPIPEEEAPKTLRTGEMPPLSPQPIRLETTKLDQDYQELKNMLRKIAYAEANNLDLKLDYRLFYNYDAPHLYPGRLRIQAMLEGGGSVDQDPFEVNAKLWRQIRELTASERLRKIKLDPQKINEDYQKLQEGLHALQRAKAANRSFEIKYTLHYQYLRPELYRDFYLEQALTIGGPSVTIDAFKRNAEILREIHAMSRPIRR